MASKSRAKILAAAEELGIKVEEIEWQPIGAAGEKTGSSGGWTIYDSEGNDYLGYNCDEVIKDMRSHVDREMHQREIDRHYRRGLRNAAQEKDIRIAELLAILPPHAELTRDAGNALREFRNATLRDFISEVYRETHRQTGIRTGLGSDAAAVPPAEVQDVWNAFEVIMSKEFGEHWRDAGGLVKKGANTEATHAE